MATDAVETKDQAQARSRLIDHFKRVYTIVVGLAITEAVKRLFPLDPDDPPVSAIWMFATFFITLVPIFHGGDRSLDVKYLSSSPATFGRRLSYLWDVYMLLLTAILFVCIAETIPQQVKVAGGADTYPHAGLFYGFMAVMLTFDVIVLIVDRFKSETRAALRPYLLWMVCNVALAVVCFVSAFGIGVHAAPTSDTLLGVWNATIPFGSLTIAVFAFAVVRTFVDYLSDHIAGGNFLFP